MLSVFLRVATTSDTVQYMSKMDKHFFNKQVMTHSRLKKKVSYIHRMNLRKADQSLKLHSSGMIIEAVGEDV